MMKLFGFPLNDLSTRLTNTDTTTSLYSQSSSPNGVINSSEPRNIISFNPDDASPIVLQEVKREKNGFGGLSYRYKVKYSVDYLQAIKANAFGMNVHVVYQPFGFGNASAANPNIVINKALATETKTNIITSILTNQAKTLDYVRAERGGAIQASYVFDLSSKITKQELTALKASLTIADLTNQLPEFLERSYETIRANLLRKYNIEPTSLDVNKFGGTNDELSFLTADKNTLIDQFKETYTSYLFDVLRDPSELTGIPTKNVSTAFHAFNGLISGLNNSDSNPNNNLELIPDIAGNPTFQLVRSQLLGLTNKALNEDRDISDSEFVTIPTIKTLSKKPVTEYIDIPETLISNSNFFLQFEIIDYKGLTVQMFASNVRHQFMSSVITTPTIPPKVLFCPKGKISKNIFNIKQLDPNGVKVKIYRKEMSRSLPSDDAFYTCISTVQCEYGADFIRFVDANAPSSNPMIYRFTSVNPQGSECPTFSSCLIQNDKKTLDRSSGVSNKSRIANIYAYFDRGSAEVCSLKVKNIPAGVISIDVSRKDLLNKEKEIIDVISNYKVNGGLAQTHSFLDKTVKNNQVYEYRVGMTYRDGTFKYSKNTCIVKYKQVKQNIVNTSINNIVTTPLSNGFYDVSFNMPKENILNQQDLLKRYLESQGYDALYINNLLNSQEKDKLSPLFATEVSRVNLDTSEEDYYGFIFTDSFSESKYGPANNVSPPKAGNYMYRIITYGRAPSTMFETNTITATYNNKTYTYSPSKYKNPYTLNNGTLVSESSMIRNHSFNKWSSGDVVDIDNVTVNIADPKPSITNATVINSISGVITALEWQVKGNANKIDHFVITRKINNVNQILGKANNLGEKIRYSYLDKLDQSVKGSLYYFITPILFDGTSGGITVLKNTIIN